MKWCSACGKYVNPRIEKTEIRTGKWLLHTCSYHCSDCHRFIESDESKQLSIEMSCIKKRKKRSYREHTRLE